MWNLFLKHDITLNENAYYFIAQETVEHRYRRREVADAQPHGSRMPPRSRTRAIVSDSLNKSATSVRSHIVTPHSFILLRFELKCHLVFLYLLLNYPVHSLPLPLEFNLFREHAIRTAHLWVIQCLAQRGRSINSCE